ncbi:uncharacterized protein LOC135397271 [Ornithodoros turicata]|uniref:uncharacterized protein LOC135397271 n=1 Tax=Ornithodoros turicata TaxID=34597 RepID=UPI003138F442
MRLSGPSKRRRDTPARIPPLWTGRASTAPLWRYPPLGSPFFVPAPFLPPAASEGGPSTSSTAVPPKKDAKIVQFEWNGCTFYRYIPDGSKMGSSRIFPTDPFGRSRGFDLGWDRGRRPAPRSQSRRRKQMQQNSPVPRPPWSSAALADTKQPPYRGPFRPRDNPRIPRKEAKPPSSHIHLPPFLAGTPSKTGSSTSTTKSPSPISASTSSGPTRTTPPAFQPRQRETVLPFAARAFGMSDSEFSSPTLPKKDPKKQTAPAKKVPEVPETDSLGAKPKKPAKITPSTPKPAERPPAFGSKTFNRGPPFRNSPRVYSSTVLKDFNTGSKLDLGDKTIPSVVMSIPAATPAPKEQRKPEKRVRYRAEIVGSNIIVTRADSEASSPEKADSAAKPGEAQEPVSNATVEDKASCSPKNEDMPSKLGAGDDKVSEDFDNLDTTYVVGESGEKVKDAFTQLAGSLSEDEGDRVITVNLSDERFTSESTSHDGTPMFSESEDFSIDGRSSRSVQTDFPESPECEVGPLVSETSKEEIQDGEKQRAEEGVKPELGSRNLVQDEHKTATSSGMSYSHTSFSEEPPTTSGSEMYLDSLISSPHEDDVQRSCDVQRCDATTSTKLLLDDLDVFLKDCSPIRSPEKDAAHADDDGSLNQVSISEGEITATVQFDSESIPPEQEERISTNSEMILINFAEDTSTLKEHLDSLVADYRSKVVPVPSDSEDDPDNILERHEGSSPTESCAPVLKPADVSPVKSEGQSTDTLNETCGAGDVKIDASEASEHKSFRADGSGVDEAETSQSFCSTCEDMNSSQRGETVLKITQNVEGMEDVVLQKGSLSPRNIKEERDRDIIPCFVEESVEYVLESEEEEYELKRRLKSGTSKQGDDRYPENRNSWQNADRKHRVPAPPEVVVEKDTAPGLIYDCPWWTYAQSEDPTKRVAGRKAEESPWSILGAEDPVEDEESSVTTEGNVWQNFLVKSGELTLPSGGEHTEEEDQCTRSDADFSALYIDDQPVKPSLKPHWTTESLQNSTMFDRDSISFYDMGGEQQDGEPQRLPQSVSMETLMSTSRLNPEDVPGNSPVESGRQEEGDEQVPDVEECAHGDTADTKEAEDDAPGGNSPVRKSGQVVTPSQPGVDGDPGEGNEVDGGPGGSPCDDAIAEKKTADKPMGKIRTRFRDFFWKHK